MDIKRKIATGLNRLVKNHTYTSQHGLAKGLKRKGGLAFLPTFIPRPTVMLEEEKFLMSLDFTGQTVYDIGGDQGIYTLFFARSVGSQGKVITFEPNPASYEQIVTNVELNRFANVNVRHIGLGEREGQLIFVFPGSEPARGSADEAIKAQILQEKGSCSIEIRVNSLDSEMVTANLPKPDFVKIDVEGLEMSVLLGMRRILEKYKPKLLIEIHGADMKSKEDNARQVVSFLLDAGYSVYHVESKQIITSSNTQAARQGHIYCT